MACLSAIRKGREWFDARIAEHMEPHFPLPKPRRAGAEPAPITDKAINAARTDNAYHVAEFFYVAQELELLRRDRLPQLIARHNADMRALLGDARRAWSMGLSPQRLKMALFSDEQQKKIFEGQDKDDEEQVHLDQSDIGRLLSPLMAEEICRQILAALSKGGLLEIRGYGRKFVSSPGILEDYFREHLLIIDRAMRDPA